MKKLLFRIVLFAGVIAAVLILFLRFAPDNTRLDGFGVSGAQHSFLDDSSMNVHLDLAEEIGFGWYRVTLPWSQVESAPNQIAWAFTTAEGNWDFLHLLQGLRSRGIDPLVVLDGGPIFLQHTYPSNPVGRAELLSAWESYVSAVVSAFGDQVDAWEIGNQPNTNAYWGRLLYPAVDLASASIDKDLYVQMLSIAHQAIKTADPNDVVVLGGLYLSPENSCDSDVFGFLAELNRSGSWDNFDVIGLHLDWGASTPQETRTFNVGHDPYSGACQLQTPLSYDMISAVQSVYDFSNQFGRKPVWVTSLGWKISDLEQLAASNGSTSSRQESDMITRSVIPLLSLEGVEKVFYYSLYTDPLQPEYALGPFGMQTFSNLASQLTASQELGSFEDAQSTPGIAHYRFQKNGVLFGIIFRQHAIAEPGVITLAGTQGKQAKAFYLDAVGFSSDTAQALTLDQAGNVVALVGNRPVMVIVSSDDPLESISLGVQDRVTVLQESVQSGFSNLMGSAKSALLGALDQWFEELKQKAISSAKDKLNP